VPVQIDEVEVVPRPAHEERPAAPAAAEAPKPDLGQEIAKTVAILHARDLRLRAD
jgi:hypothetical protein